MADKNITLLGNVMDDMLAIKIGGNKMRMIDAEIGLIPVYQIIHKKLVPVRVHFELVKVTTDLGDKWICVMNEKDENGIIIER